ncbi:MAG: hypothetical protein KNU04_gp51 [crAssphage sp. isolate ctbg_1]|uniref:Uncharacterized protein n=1 Tax=crAssphage sp. isolate ctbg_1 TaxID=2989854 RepID=A0A345MT26_9CAUD|nr:MAG: hypothetical protein KNU04_gp51 [crAssphage sp. isolate ctbg_1]AXH74526.1 MAG: hypothetical protein [crAssphage sp. isolate ctbg_1]
MSNTIKNKYHSDAVKRLNNYKIIYNYYINRCIYIKRCLYNLIELRRETPINKQINNDILCYSWDLRNIRHQLNHYQTLIKRSKKTASKKNRTYNKKHNIQ